MKVEIVEKIKISKIDRLLTPGLLIVLSAAIAGFVSTNPLLVCIPVVLAVLTFFGLSISKLVSSLWISLMMLSAASMLFHLVFPMRSALYLNKAFLAGALFVATFFLYRSWKVAASWQNDFAALLISLAVVFSVFTSKLFETGGAIAALFSNEDNAAWVASTFVAQGKTENTAGIFGPFIDLNLYIFHEIASVIVPDVREADQIAIAIILFQIVLLSSIPFLVTSVISWLGIVKDGTSSSLPILSFGLIFSSANFMFYGHMSAAIAIVLLALLTIAVARASDGFRLIGFASALVFLTLLVVGETWFPIAPLTLALALYLLYLQRKSGQLSTASNRASFIIGILCSALIATVSIFSRLSQIASYKNVKSTSAFDGANFLLTTEGGVAAIGPFSIQVVTFLALISIATFLAIRFRANSYISLLSLFLIFALVTRGSNLLFSQGIVNYGSRKLDTFIALLLLSILLWLVVVAFENSDSKQISTWNIAVLALVILSQIPSSDSLLARNGFSGVHNSSNLAIGKSIASAAVTGTNLVCATLDDSPYPNDTRYLAYKCSRFSAAYTNTDNEEANNLRASLIARIDESSWKSVSNALPENTRVITVDSGILDPLTLSKTKYRNLFDPNWVYVTKN